MSYAAALCEPVPYSASLAESTQTTRSSSFRAEPPVASPTEVMKLDRNTRMMEFLLEELSKTTVEPKLSALENMFELLTLLPADLPATDPYISETGSICLDWDFYPDCQLSILLKDKNQIAYAAYFLGEKVHGSSRFSSSGLPEGLANAAKRWIRTANARS